MDLIQEVSNKQLFVFDVDGVIIDSVDIYVNAVQFVCEKLGYPQSKDDYFELSKDIHYENRVFPGPLIEEANELFHDYVDEVQKPENFPLIPGSREVLNLLNHQEKNIAFFSSKSKLGLDAVLDFHNISSKINVVISRDCVNDHKPSPDGLFLIKDTLGIDAEKTIMFGDADFDLQAAQAANVDFIGVNSGTNKSHHWERQSILNIESIKNVMTYL